MELHFVLATMLNATSCWNVASVNATLRMEFFCQPVKTKSNYGKSQVTLKSRLGRVRGMHLTLKNTALMFLKIGRPGWFILQKDSRDSSGPEKYFIFYDISTISSFS